MNIEHIAKMITNQSFGSYNKYFFDNYIFSVYRPEKETEDDYIFDIVVCDKNGKPLHDEFSLYGGDVEDFLIDVIEKNIKFQLID